MTTVANPYLTKIDFRGRPPKDPIKLKQWNEAKAALKAAGGAPKASNGKIKMDAVPALPIVETDETDAERILRITDRMDCMKDYADGVVNGVVRNLIISGAGGVGKSFMIENTLKHAKETEGLDYIIVHATISALGLYKLGYKYRQPNQIIVLDDSDGVFQDEDALSVLKAMLDTNAVRNISWFSETAALKKEDIPQQFQYEGSMIFITNLDFQAYVDRGAGKYVPHMQALMTRADYLDLMLHTPNDLMAWIGHLVKMHHILVQHELTAKQEQEILEFMRENKNKFRALSVRTALQLGRMYRLFGEEKWKVRAAQIALRPNATT